MHSFISRFLSRHLNTTNIPVSRAHSANAWRTWENAMCERYTSAAGHSHKNATRGSAPTHLDFVIASNQCFVVHNICQSLFGLQREAARTGLILRVHRSLPQEETELLSVKLLCSATTTRVEQYFPAKTWLHFSSATHKRSSSH